MKRERGRRVGAAAAVVVSMAGVLIAVTPARAETAADVMRRVRELEDGPRKWTDRKQKARFTIYDAGGKERVRETESFNRRDPDGEEKALLFFRSPAEIGGTGFLQWAHRGRDDEQWLYLPEVKRVRQIGARAKKESFAATDFSYRDLEIMNEITRWTDADAKSVLAADEQVGGEAAYVVRFTPNDPAATGYEAVRLWLRKSDLSVVRLELADADGPVKVLELTEIRDADRIPIPHRLEMRDVKSGSRTVIDVLEVQHDSGLAEDLFTQRTLERGEP